MPAHLVTPLQALFSWLDERPAVRLLFTLGLVCVAVFATLPGWILDLWLVCSLTAAIGTATLLVAVGPELAPREVLSGLPAYLRRGFFHRMALAIALTKAIVTGHHPGVLLEWLAQGGLASSVGVGIAVVAALYVAQLGLGAFFHDGAPTRQHPEVVAAARQIFALLLRHALLGMALAACLLGAGLLTGLLIKQWPLGMTLTTLTLYGLAEACFTAAPGLVVGGAMAHWLAQALEVPEEEPVVAPVPAPLMALEVGRELAPSLRRAVPLQVAALRTRLDEELGLLLPRVGLSVSAEMPARMARVQLQGLPERWIELAEFESLESIAQLLSGVARDRADALLTLDATHARLDELALESPVLVQQAVERLGLPAIHGVLKGLLREQVPTVDLAGLLEALVLAPEGASVPVLVEHARRASAHAISVRVASDAGEILAFELESGWDEALAGFLSWDTGLAADWSAGAALVNACKAAVDQAGLTHSRPVLLVPRRFRPLVAEVLRAHGLKLPVLAPDEVSSRFTLRLAGGVARPQDATVR